MKTQSVSMETAPTPDESDVTDDDDKRNTNHSRRRSLPPSTPMIDIRLKYRILQRWSCADDTDTMMSTCSSSGTLIPTLLMPPDPMTTDCSSSSDEVIGRRSSYNPSDYTTVYRNVCSSGEDADVLGELRGSLSPSAAFYRRQSVFDPSRWCMCVINVPW